MTVTTNRRRPILWLLGLSLLGGAWWVLPQLRMAKVDYVAHADARRAGIGGHVRDAAGKPIAGIEVTWFAATSAGSLLGAQAFQGGALRTETAADGTFSFAAVPDAEGYAAIQDSSQRFEGSSGHVRPRAGFVATPLGIVAEPVEATRRLRGQLRTATGAPAAFVPVKVLSDGLWRSWQCSRVTDAEGRFEVVGPRPGMEVRLTLTPDGSAPTDLGTHHLGDSVELTTDRAR